MLINIQIIQQDKIIEINEQLLQQNNRSDMHINSPQFSNSSKGNLSNIISPTRNKRIVSSQHCFSALPSHRNNNNNSCKKLDSPSIINQIVHKDKDKDKMRKKSTHGTNITNNVYNGHIKTKSKDMVMEMNGLKQLKQQYMILKVKYKELVSDKVKWVEKQHKIQEENINNKKVIQKLERENDNLKGKIGFLETEIDRIKRESVKLVQVWEFRIRSVQQNLLQKQKIIADLRQCLKDHKIAQPRSSSKRSHSPNIINQQNNQTIYNKSLSMLRQSLRGTDYLSSLSEASQYLNGSLSQIRQSSQLIQTVYNKHHLISIDVENTLQDITNKTTQQPKGKKNEGNFKKIKKQLGKKIQINCEDKQRQIMVQILPKTPMDRKGANNKSTKVPKIKIRKQQEYVESKSSKKKMSAR